MLQMHMMLYKLLKQLTENSITAPLISIYSSEYLALSHQDFPTNVLWKQIMLTRVKLEKIGR